MVERLASRQVQTSWGEFQAVAYRDLASGALHLALAHGDITPEAETLVRVHEPTSVIDALFEGGTGHSWSVHNALKAIKAAPCGVLILMNCQGDSELLFSQFDARSEEHTSELTSLMRISYAVL